MRLLNWLLHFVVVLIMCWAMNARAQVNAWPVPLQSNDQDSDGATLPNSVTSGHCITGIANTINGTAPVPTTTDTAGVVPSITMGNQNFALGTSDSLTPYWGTATSTGATSLSTSCTGTPAWCGQTQIEWPCSNFTIDDHGHGGGGAGVTNPSVNVTTSAQNDLVFCFLSTNGNPTVAFSPSGTNAQYIGNTGWGEPRHSYFAIAGAAGTYACSWTGSGNANVVGISFKPTNLTLVTQTLPDCAVNQLCYFQLQAYGGSGSYTFSRTGGSWPTGCSDASLTGSTGIASCPPTAAGAFSLTFQVSDGTHTSSAGLSLTVGASFGTPVLTAYGFGQNVTIGGFSGGTGDLVAVVFMGFNQHNADGYALPSGSIITQPCGDQLTRWYPVNGANVAGQVVYRTKLSCAGLITLQSHNWGNGSSLNGFILHGVNAQIMDNVVTAVSSPGNVANATLTPSITTVVPNMQLISATSLSCTVNLVACNTTTSTNSPWVTVSGSPFADQFGDTDIAQLAAPTVGTYSATGNFHDGYNGNLATDTPLMTLIPIRPDIPNQGTFAGDKVRRVSY